MLADQAAPAAAPAQVPVHCPGCWSPAAPGTSFCPACGFWLAGPQAAELHWIESELQYVDAARTWLIRRRAILLGELMAGRPGPAGPGVPPVRAGTPGEEPSSRNDAARQTARTAGPGPARATGPGVSRPEISGQDVARLLLAAGAALLVIAAAIFTIAGWSRLGEPGRAGILTAITALTLACAPMLLRRDRRDRSRHRPGPDPGRRVPGAAGRGVLAALEIGWCATLAAAGTGSPEPYVVPAALIALAPVLRRPRQEGAGSRVSSWRSWGPGLALGRARPEAGSRVSSWRSWGPGLALGFLPSLIACWLNAGWIRPAALAACAAVVAVAGGRARLRAPLLAGTAVAVLAAARELAPVAARLVGALPGWVPVAAIGAVLLWAGATYEARLRNLRAVRRSLAAMD